MAKVINIEASLTEPLRDIKGRGGYGNHTASGGIDALDACYVALTVPESMNKHVGESHTSESGYSEPVHLVSVG